MIELQLITNKLKNELSFLQQKFETGERNKNKRDRQYFEFVKSDSKLLFDLINKWHEKTIALMNSNNISLYEEQINSTKENFEMLILHSYYSDIRKRRYIEMNRSCIYVFDQLLKEIE